MELVAVPVYGWSSNAQPMTVEVHPYEMPRAGSLVAMIGGRLVPATRGWWRAAVPIFEARLERSVRFHRNSQGGMTRIERQQFHLMRIN